MSFGESDNITISRTGYGAVGEHSILVTTDEDGHVVREFNDISGKTIQMIKEDHTNSGTEYLITYYVYDKAGRLVAVLPPILSDCLTGASSWSSSDCDEIKQYGYFYRYDAKGRQIAKKIPGADWVYYIYDKNGRQILSQDGNQRSRGEWTFFLEDHIGRPCLKGIWVNQDLDPFNSPYGNVNVYVIKNSSNTALYGYLINGMTLTSPKVHIVNWWDDYSFPVNLGNDTSYDAVFQNTANADAPYTESSRGLRTGGLVKTLGEEDENHYLWEVRWYDENARPVQTVRNTGNGDIERTGIAYDFTGNLVRRHTRHTQFNGEELTESYSYSYDNWGRSLVTSLSLNGGVPVIIHDYSYDGVGRLIGDRQADASGEVISHIRRNIRSWVTEKTVCTSAQDTLFSQNLRYNNYPQDSTVTVRWNGGISVMSWKDGLSEHDQLFKYKYDGLGRLISALYFDGDNSVPANNRSYQYDKHGNVTGVQLLQPYSTTYTGNQLSSMANTSTQASSVRSRVFYSYDGNGNRTMERLFQQPVSYAPKVSYNILNLPSSVSGYNKESHYVYSAAGEKLSREWTRTSMGVQVESHRIDYSGNLVYVDSTLTAVLFDGGYFTMTGHNPSFHVLVTDNQGNVRVDTNTDGTDKAIHSYAPYGEMITPLGSTPLGTVDVGLAYGNLYRYGGKEWDDILGSYDFGARYYTPGIIPVWTSVDPLQEQYYAMSPYVYCAGDPVNLVDPDGMEIWIYTQNMSMVQYHGGGLFNNDGSLYQGNDVFAIKIQSTLNNLLELNDSVISKVISTLEDSKQKHTFVYNSKYNDSTQARGEYGNSLANGGTPVGTWIKLSLNKDTVDGVPNNEMLTISHELLHSYDYDTGGMKGELPWDKSGIPPSEIRAVNFENRVRVRTGMPKRTKYGAPIPPSLLNNPWR